MTSLIEGGVDFVRCAVFGGKSMSRGRGTAFENAPSDWFAKVAKKYRMTKTDKDVWRMHGQAA